MYSKYLDYSETAILAHQAAQVENDQKDILIGSLKNQLYELRQLQNDFMRLNDYIVSLEDKYSLLLNEKDRSEKQQRIKMDINQSSIISLRQEFDELQSQIQKMNLKIEDLLRGNINMKRMSDARAGQIQNLRHEIKALQARNSANAQQNQGLALTIKSLKQQRGKLQADCDNLSNTLSKNVAYLKNLEKQVRNSQSNNARLDKTLHQAEGDNVKLVAEYKQKNQQAKRSEIKLNSLRQNISELKLTYGNIVQQADKNKLDNANNAANLEREINKGKALSANLNEVQASIRVKQNELDLIISQEQQLRKQHYAGIERNKSLNGQIDRLLALILQYEAVNKQLLDEIEIYIDQDEQARQILNRRDNMRMLIENTLRKMEVTNQPIRHLKSPQAAF